MNKTYLGYTALQWKMLIEFAILVAVLMLAYNIGHYDSLQYQSMCGNCREQCQQPVANLSIQIEDLFNDRQNEAFS